MTRSANGLGGKYEATRTFGDFSPAGISGFISPRSIYICKHRENERPRHPDQELGKSSASKALVKAIIIDELKCDRCHHRKVLAHPHNPNGRPQVTPQLTLVRYDAVKPPLDATNVKPPMRNVSTRLGELAPEEQGELALLVLLVPCINVALATSMETVLGKPSPTFSNV